MFESFKTRMSRNGSHMGQVLKNQSDMIMDATFDRDIAFRKCYLLKSGAIFPAQNEIEYRKAKNVFFGRDKYEPEKMSQFEEIDCKYLVHTYASLDKDAVDYYLQFRPNAHAYNPNIRVGALVFIPDDIGEYKLWLIAARDDRPQFPQWYVLQCDWLLEECCKNNIHRPLYCESIKCIALNCWKTLRTKLTTKWLEMASLNV